jgi:hypothetical protein
MFKALSEKYVHPNVVRMGATDARQALRQDHLRSQTLLPCSSPFSLPMSGCGQIQLILITLGVSHHTRGL